MQRGIKTHEGWPEHLISFGPKGKGQIVYIQKGAPIAIQWRPDAHEFRFEEVVGVTEGVRYVTPRGADRPLKLIDILTKRRIISVDEKRLTKLIPVADVLGRRSV